MKEVVLKHKKNKSFKLHNLRHMSLHIFYAK
jgi:hypothetical protein